MLKTLDSGYGMKRKSSVTVSTEVEEMPSTSAAIQKDLELLDDEPVTLKKSKAVVAKDSHENVVTKKRDDVNIKSLANQILEKVNKQKLIASEKREEKAGKIQQ